ncbi:MAG: Uma2 family endonuclease [Cruoricaptor ignavus]|nr:Uma2 family endonuclease [Cruoricaptor ignavus]
MSEILNINQLDPNGSYTYADYLLWKFQERLELIKGKILKMSPAPSLKHQVVSGNLYLSFGKYLEGKTCKIISAPFDVRLTTKDKKNNEVTTVVQPDLCVICDLEKLDDKGCVGSPDLIIEILSPGNSKKEIKIKYELYEESGVREYWIVKPEYEEIAQYVLENGKYYLKNTFVDTETEISPEIFPELKINVGSIFK